jgi:hypothetical protein
MTPWAAKCTLAVHGGARHVERKTGSKPAGACDVPRLDAHRVQAAENHVIDIARVHVIAD